MGTIMLNGIQYGGETGGGDFAGAAFIDTDNVIVTLTALPSSVVGYTATEDCYLYVQLGGQQENYVDIDGERAFYSHSTNWQIESGLMPLAKGQTAEIHGRQTNDYYAVYGVKYSGGSSGGGGGVDYSTTEQDTGLKWVDGSSIYQKTIDFGAMPVNEEKDVAHGISNLSYVTDIEFMVYNATNVQWRSMPSISRGNIAAQSVYGVNSQYIYVLGGQNADVDSNWTGIVTLRYTKTGGNA